MGKEQENLEKHWWSKLTHFSEKPNLQSAVAKKTQLTLLFYSYPILAQP